MSGTKAQVVVQNVYAFLRSDIRIILCVILLFYNLFSFNEWKQYNTKRSEVLERLNILRQMQEYAKQHCPGASDRLTNNMDTYGNIFKGTDVKKDSINNEVTFILLGPTIRCLIRKISWFKSRYKGAKILIAVNLGISAVNEQGKIIFPASDGYFLGRFTSIPAALNHAIQLVNTKYFMIIDHEMDLDNIQDNFIEVFLANLPGYDLLSGSVVNTLGEFSIPCTHLKLQYWSYSESYQYNISGNILQCHATSLYFIARNEAFKNLMITHDKPLFDVNIPSKWLEDFFIQFQQVLKVGVLPEVIIKQKVPNDCFKSRPAITSISKQVEKLLPFAKKYQLFYIKNETSRIDICKDSEMLACSERGIQKQWSLRHWSDGGLTTYPFIIESLQNALHFGTNRLEESQLMYVIEGGTLLGMVKLRDILPWDHGDVDTFVYSTRRKVINMVKESFRQYGYEFWLRHTGFHTYVSDDPTSWNGCIVYLTRRLKPKAIIYMRHQGKLFPVKRDLFTFLRQFYGSLFLENHMKISNQRSFCKIPGHHACLPDCRWDGCGGGLR